MGFRYNYRRQNLYTNRPHRHYSDRLLAEDGNSFICYLRNIAGTSPIQADPAAGWTRSRAKTHLRVTVHIPLKANRLEVFDLDDGTTRTVPCERARPISLGVTDHDVVLFALAK